LNTFHFSFKSKINREISHWIKNTKDKLILLSDHTERVFPIKTLKLWEKTMLAIKRVALKMFETIIHCFVFLDVLFCYLFVVNDPVNQMICYFVPDGWNPTGSNCLRKAKWVLWHFFIHFEG
jgi:hypothetical protein